MRFLIASLMLLVAASITVAQPTIIHSNFGFTESRSFYEAEWLTHANLEVGVPSLDSAQVFDFSKLYYDHTLLAQWHEDTILHLPKYSGATDMRIEVGPWYGPMDTVRSYYSTMSGVSGDTIFFYGYASALGDTVILTSPTKFIPFPLHVGDYWSDRTSGLVEGSNVPVTINSVADAYGTLLLPSGSFQCIRIVMTIDYTKFREYRYMYITTSPYVSACLISNSSTATGNNHQNIARAEYTGPIPKYNKYVAPNLTLSGPSSPFRVPINGTDTVHILAINSGDTTAIIDSSFLNSSNPSDISLVMNPDGAPIAAGDTFAIPFALHPQNTSISNAIFFVFYGGSGVGTQVSVQGVANGVNVISDAPATLPSAAAYPNPFHASTNISYSLPSDGLVTISLFNSAGVPVARIASGHETAGMHTQAFDGSNLPNGSYRAEIQSVATDGTITRQSVGLSLIR